VARNALIGVWLACLLAVYDVVGARVTDMPLTPERILRGLGRVKD
jgi:CO/xanthine dehydrogenase Mo-binding subunit